MHSLRARLLALWLMLVASGTVTGLLLLEFYRQSGNAQLGRAEESAARACRDIVERYQFLVSGWSGSTVDDALDEQLNQVVNIALAPIPGVEGGVWQGGKGSLAYAFPTYEGTGPKTDVPAAEIGTIRQVNAAALRGDRPATLRQPGRSQVLIVHACPLHGPIPDLTGWTMARALTADSLAYNQLLTGLGVLALTVLGSALWLARILYSWLGKLRRLETALAADTSGHSELPVLDLTGERELDRFVEALNVAGARLAQERRRVRAAERLAAVGRLAAGLAHEIRNPIAAMRLKAENALAVQEEARRVSALRAIVEQVGRLDSLLRDLLAMSQPRQPRMAEVDLPRFVQQVIETQRELAAAKGVDVQVGTLDAAEVKPIFDAEQMQRAIDNLILNALESGASAVTISARHRGHRLCFRVEDTGAGVPEALREQLFEPFVSGRAEGTGLGLALVQEIARSHGGEARYVPAGNGAIFEIDVPWRPS